MVISPSNLSGGVAEWSKAAVLKTVERKFRGFESYLLRQMKLRRNGRVAEGAPLLRAYRRNLIEGSNPSLSANILYKSMG